MNTMVSLFLTRKGYDHLLRFAPDALTNVVRHASQTKEHASKTRWSIDGVRYEVPVAIGEAAFNELLPRMGLLDYLAPKKGDES